MQNLKITLKLETPVILDRLTTIDSILLSCYYRHKEKMGIKLDFDKEHKTVDFIHKENGVFSGSVWYIDKYEHVTFDFQTIIKKPEYEKIHKHTGANSKTDSMFKGAMIPNELILVGKIHFYIRGKRKYIEALVKDAVKNIGKYGKLDYGKVAGYEIEEIEEDKGFMLNGSTPSKPLPITDFKVDSKKIALSRRSAPYWLNEDIEACYMPTSSMYESVDNSSKKEFEVASDVSYVSNVEFIYTRAFNTSIEKKDVVFNNKSYSDYKGPRKTNFEYTQNNKTLRCAFSGDISNEGMKNDAQDFIKRIKPSFGDWEYIKNNDFVSKEVLWCIDNIAELGNLYLDNKQWNYAKGARKEEGKKINDMIKNISLFRPPFSVNLKDTQNSQHVSFKGKVSVSNGYFYVQLGNKTLHIDGELLKEAIEDIYNIEQEYKEISKTHLCRNFKDSFNISLKKKNREINEKIVMEFQKKYDKDIRYLLNTVAL